MAERGREGPHPGWIAAAVAAAAFWAFAPALRNGFAWDDAENFLANPHFRGLGWTQLRWMFTTAWLGPYQPLSWLSAAVDWTAWGFNPVGWHLTNLLLHAANAALFFFLARRLLPRSPRALWCAAAAALLFSVHPLRVEAVVWATERRTLLAGFFYFAALLCWLEEGRARRAALPLFACSLLSKGIGIGLPFTLLALDVHARRRPDIREKAPFFLLAAAFGAVELAAYAPGVPSPVDAAARACFALIFYAVKTVLPLGLSPSYDFVWPLALCGPAVAGAAWWLWAERGRRPWAWASAIHYAAALAPVLGLVKFGEHAVADRYSYLSCAVFPLLAAGWLSTLEDRKVFPRAAAAAAALAVGLGVMSWRQSFAWRDSLSLWTRAYAVDPGSVFARKRLSQAYYNVGNEFLRAGRAREAGRFYFAAVRVDADNALAHNNLGTAMLNLGLPDEAVSSFCRALGADPRMGGSAANLRAVLVRYPKLNGRLDAGCRAALTTRE
ncbi:MAG: hypothetical protein M0D55_01285 [Elusimicrobiota bacterium]|nr:MAG: hypothetical protein M0D55_01285 [Elusimicrobiota bacterium]